MHVRPNLKSIRLGSRHRRTATKRSICTNARERTEQAKRRAIHPRMCQRALGGSQAPTMRNTSARTDTFRPFEAPAVVERRLPEHSALLVLILRCRAPATTHISRTPRCAPPRHQEHNGRKCGVRLHSAQDGLALGRRCSKPQTGAPNAPRFYRETQMRQQRGRHFFGPHKTGRRHQKNNKNNNQTSNLQGNRAIRLNRGLYGVTNLAPL